MEIKNEKELQNVLESKIEIPIFWQENIDNSRVYIDEEYMIDEFTTRLREIVEAVENY